VMTTKRPYVVENIAEDELLSPEDKIRIQNKGFHSAVQVPLLGNDQSIGVLVVMDTRIRQFTDGEVSLLTAFADQAALGREKSRLLNEAEERKDRQLRSVPIPGPGGHYLINFTHLFDRPIAPELYFWD